MAKCEIKMPDEFLIKCSRLAEKTDDILPRVLEDGGRIVLAQVKSNLQGVLGKTKYPSRSTGELLGSLGLSPALIDRNGNHNVRVGFSEPRRHQTSARGRRSYYTITNAMLASVLEYGKHGQPPRPFLKPARSASRRACIDAMKAALEREMNSI